MFPREHPAGHIGLKPLPKNVRPYTALVAMDPRRGEGGIRTHGTLAGASVFKTDAFDRSATSPTSDDIGPGQAGLARSRGETLNRRALGRGLKKGSHA